jgi:hypothetical protein
MKIEWKDATTYSQSDKERKPTAWEVDHDGLRIHITCDHARYPKIWIMSCYRAGFKEYELKECATAHQAKGQALARIKSRLAALLRAVNEIENGTPKPV